MVMGMDSFREALKGYEDCYTVIGGAACDILMSNVDLSFRATKDIDMILLLEDRAKEFSDAFWSYIKEGGYKCGWKNSETVHFYRFTEPKPGYPIQIELFSRLPDYHLETVEGIIPIHIDDEVSSLSAIVLNEDFYHFMMDGRKTVLGVSVLEADYLIPFKMYAWLDLGERKSRGEHVNEKDLRKHKYDVFRLLEIVSQESRVEVTGLVKDVVIRFLEKIEAEKLPLDQIGLTMTKDEGLEKLRKLYLVGE